jgi:amino acid adenylation domain-containing protein/non-ribosomal peptide synthase protein (TIGR01720 family)
MIYTSGSTGRPKGAMNTHRAIVNRLHWMQEAYQLRAGERVLQKTPFSFDVSVWEFFWPLLTGGCVVLARPGGQSDSVYLSRLIEARQITTVHFVPSMLQVFLEEPGLAEMACLKRVICSGEALSYELQERFFARLGAELHNLYGPTEAAVDVTFWACERGGGRHSVPIGRPIANTQIFILDEQRQAVPVGVAGELYIGGVGVARGYLKRAELTAEKFIPDAFSAAPGARLYRTGDRARYLAGGEIEYLGRLDQQVKIRGFRIELGEIEAVLAEHPGIRENCVVARTDMVDEARVVAYLVPVRKGGLTVNELRLFLLDKLPDYMVPSTFVMLDSLPLTPNGKVNRAELPAPDQSRPMLLKGYVAPGTPGEQLLTKIWEEVLRLEKVGVHDNFFELGGDSILVIQAIIKSNRLGIRLTAAQYFQQQTIAGLAQVADITSNLTVQEDRHEAATAELPLVELDQDKLDSLTARYGHIQDIYPLTPTQQGMLFQHLYAPESKAYLQQVTCDLHGELDSQTFRFTWQRIFARHPVLRSAFIWEGLKEPLQVVSQEVQLQFAEEDWRELEIAEQQAKLKSLLANEKDQNFDLTQSPVSRHTLIRLADDDYKFIWSYHHILMDGWSLNVLIEEFFTLYESLRNGRALELEPRAPFRNYIAWLRGQDMAGAEAYWRNSLKGFIAPTPLGVDKALPDTAEVEEFGEVSLRLSATATSRLQSLTRKHKLTMSTVVQGAWGLLLAHYSGLRDVVFGTVVSGRPPELAGVETMVGLFINTMPVRVEVRAETTVVEWLRELQERQAEARRYEYSPLVQVQAWSEVPRGVPLFESLLAFQNYPFDISPEKQPVSMTTRNVSSQERVNYALFVIAGPGTELDLTINYDARRFERTTVERMLGHLRTLLEQTVANPFQQLSKITLVAPGERRQLLAEWNDTRVEYPQNACVHQLFEAQAARTPQRIAVVSVDQRLTYAELDRRANQLANYLRLQGVGKEILVGICVERTVEMIVGLLAILKAGGAYVPLDPTYPKERLSFIMKDAQVTLLLTQQHLLTELPAAKNVQVISLDSCTEISIESESQPESGICAGNLAYVIYTSGSTGTPKGVEITHRAVVNFLHSMREQPGLTDSDVLLAITSLSFDIAGLELFLPLMVGARLELASRQETGDGSKLMARLRESGATVMQATPTGWELLLNAGWHNQGQRLKVLCGGEAFPRGLATRLLEEHECVWNLYGPTETTIWSTMSQVVHASGSVPIGRPIANTQVYIANADLDPTPIGVTGDLYIGGDGLSRGYRGRPGLTAEKFIPDPFSGCAGARLYRTGDVARYLADGEIEFLGRNDQQVKIRGFRIEIGEIEAALSRYQGVRQAVVSAREDVPGEKRLVAYIVWDGVASAESPPQHAGALRTHLKHSLPDYMLPATFIELDQLPLTPNGKVDRRALPAPDHLRPDLDKAYVEARTVEEALLVEIWKEVLGVERVGVHDNFLELGGDSILSLRVIIKATQAGMQLTPAQLFQRQTVAELAPVLPPLSLPGSIFRDLSDKVPLTPIQQWFFEQNLPEQHHFNQAVLLEVPVHLEAALIERAVEELFIRHDALRLRFVNVEGVWQQTVSALGGETPFSAYDFSSQSEKEQSADIERVADKIQRGLNLSEGPLAGFALIRLGEQKSSRLLIVIHHLAVDITSWRILLEDFQTACEQFSRQEEVELPARTTSFALWSQHLNRFAQSAELSVEAEYWRNVVNHETARLPLDFEGENNEDSSGVVLSTFSREETWSLLRDLPKALRALPSEVLLTALTQSVVEWTDKKSLLVEMEGHGRESISETLDLSRTVGWFTTLYPVRLDIAEAGDSLAALKLIKEQVRNVPCGGIGFGALKYLRPESEIAKFLRAAPRAEVSFNYVGAQEPASREKSTFHQAAEKYGSIDDGRGMRPYLLMVSAQISEERLTVHWAYSKNMHRETTIMRLAKSFEEAFRSLISRCKTGDANTPSDFPNANLSQLDLDEFIATIGAER